jgi:HemY protein
VRGVVFKLIIILALGSTIAWLANHPGLVAIDWEGWHIEASLAVLAGLVALMLAGGLLVQSLWRWARHDLPFVGVNRDLNRQRRGLEALNNAVLALAAGNGRDAKQLAGRAQALLPPQPMTHVIAAQAAQMSGHRQEAKAAFENLLKDKGSAMLGVRGLLNAALVEGKRHEALRLAEEARAIDPKSNWALKTHFLLLAKEGQWAGAAEALTLCASRRIMSEAEIKKHQRTLNYTRARDADLGGHTKDARAFCDKALKLDKGFGVAAVLGARLHAAVGAKGRARKIIESAWSVRPTPELAQAFEALEDMETPAARLKRFEKLAAKNPGHFESRFQIAEKTLANDHLANNHLAGDRLKEARPLIEALISERESPRTFALMAALLLKEGGEAAEKEAALLLSQAKSLVRPPSHHCSHCYAPAKGWTPLCSNCGAFNTLERESQVRRAPIAEAAQDSEILVMLPDPIQMSEQGDARGEAGKTP